MSDIELFNCKDLGDPPVPLSHGAQVGGLIYISGQTALLPGTTDFNSADFAEQTHQVFANLTAILKSRNKTFKDVAKASVFLTDMKNFALFNPIYAAYFEKPYPARTTVAVLGLPLGALVEIELLVRA